MHGSRWMVLLLTIVLGLNAALPVRADTNDDDNRGVVLVSDDDLPPDLLSPDEVSVIERLQGELNAAAILSPISPDGQAALAVVGEEVGFLNIQDGSMVPIDLQTLFGRYFPLALFGLIEFGWGDAHTLVSAGFDLDARDRSEVFVLIRMNRLTGQVDGVPIKLPENAFPVSMSPDIARMLIVFEEETAVPNQLAARTPITWPLPAETALELPAWMQRLGEERLRRFPRAAEALQLFQNNDRSAMQATVETLQLQSLDLVTGETSDLMSIPPATQFVTNRWSLDGDSLALTLIGMYEPNMFVRGRFDGALISEQIYRDVTGQLSPEENPFFQNNTVELFDLANGKHQTLRAADEPGGPLLVGVSFSPDAQTLLVQALHPSHLAGRRNPIYFPQFSERVSFRFYDRSLQETDRLEPRELTSPQGTNASFVGPDELIISGLVGTNLHPHYYNRVSGEFRNIADRAGAYARIVASRNTGQIVFLHTSYTSPPDLYRMNWDGSGVTRLTWVNEELKNEVSLREDPVSFRLRDGSLRYGTLIQRGDATYPPQNVPLVLWQEGGPGVAMLNRWQNNVENPYGLLPSFGIGLLVVPLAGRPGYGPEAYNLLYDGNNFGQRDVDEMAEIAYTIIAKGWTSPSKLGVTGCSYGGYVTWQSIIRYPNLYAAANPQCALVDVFVEWSRGFQFLMPYTQQTTPFEQPAEYQRDSPMYNANQVRAAVLSFHGTNDFLPITQNENIHLQLVERGLTARMIKFEGSGHGITSEEYQRYAAQEQIQWFRTYLR